MIFFLSLVLCPSFYFFPGCTCLKSLHDDYSIYRALYPEGNLKTVTSYQSGKKNGIERRYKEDGSLEAATHYVNNKVDGFQNTYYPDGSLWQKELYEHGKLVERIKYDEEGRIISQEDLNYRPTHK